MHSYSAYTVCAALSLRRGNLGFQYLAQGHFGMRNGEDWDRTPYNWLELLCPLSHSRPQVKQFLMEYIILLTNTLPNHKATIQWCLTMFKSTCKHQFPTSLLKRYYVSHDQLTVNVNFQPMLSFHQLCTGKKLERVSELLLYNITL